MSPSVFKKLVLLLIFLFMEGAIVGGVMYDAGKNPWGGGLLVGLVAMVGIAVAFPIFSIFLLRREAKAVQRTDSSGIEPKPSSYFYLSIFVIVFLFFLILATFGLITI